MENNTLLITAIDIPELMPRIALYWRRLGHFLNVSDEDLENIGHEKYGYPIDQLKEVLRLCKPITVQEFLAILKRAQVCYCSCADI